MEELDKKDWAQLAAGGGREPRKVPWYSQLLLLTLAVPPRPVGRGWTSASQPELAWGHVARPETVMAVTWEQERKCFWHLEGKRLGSLINILQSQLPPQRLFQPTVSRVPRLRSRVTAWESLVCGVRTGSPQLLGTPFPHL